MIGQLRFPQTALAQIASQAKSVVNMEDSLEREECLSAFLAALSPVIWGEISVSLVDDPEDLYSEIVYACLKALRNYREGMNPLPFFRKVVRQARLGYLRSKRNLPMTLLETFSSETYSVPFNVEEYDVLYKRHVDRQSLSGIARDLGISELDAKRIYLEQLASFRSLF